MKKQLYTVEAVNRRPEFTKTQYFYNLTAKQAKKILKQKKQK